MTQRNQNLHETQNERILNGFISFNITKNTVIAILTSFSLFFSGLYTGAILNQNISNLEIESSTKTDSGTKQSIRCLRDMDGVISNCVEIKDDI